MSDINVEIDFVFDPLLFNVFTFSHGLVRGNWKRKSKIPCYKSSRETKKIGKYGRVVFKTS